MTNATDVGGQKVDEPPPDIEPAYRTTSFVSTQIVPGRPIWRPALPDVLPAHPYLDRRRDADEVPS